MRLATVILVAILLAPASALWGQTSFGEVSGNVQDASGGMIAGATVTLLSAATNIKVQRNTNTSGNFIFVNVRPGPYSLTVEMSGFKTLKVPDFTVAVGQTVTQNMKLEVGQVSQAVEVTAASPLLQASTSDLGNVIQEQVVHDLPLNGRNFTQLMLLTPGVNPVSVAQGPTSDPGFSTEGNTGLPGSALSNASIQGQQNRSKIYFYDGIINTSVRGTSYTVLPDIDMIQEFKVQSHNDKAEYGGVTGGVINMYSKSGTNQFHGSAFWLLRNDVFDARDPYRDSLRSSPLPFRQNQFGATFGGPIIHDKTFFYGGYDGWRYRDVANVQGLYPTTPEFNGDFSNTPYGRAIYNPYSTRTVDGKLVRDVFPDMKIPNELISPLMQGFMKAYGVQPNLAGDPDYNFRQSRARSDDANSFQIKVDHHFSDVDNVFFRWNEQRITNFQPITDRSGSHGNVINRNYGGGWLHTFSPTLVLEVRGGTATQPAEDAPQEHELGIQPLIDLGFKDVQRFGGLLASIGGNPWNGATYGNRGAAPRGNPNYSLTANLTWLHGNHNFKTGIQYIRIDRLQVNDYQQFSFDEQVTADPQNLGATGDNVASALLGLPSEYTGSLPADSTLSFYAQTWSGFFQDEWKVKPNLTINLGLRYDYLTRVHGKTDRMLQSGPDIATGEWLISSVNTPPPCSDASGAPCIPAASLADIPYSDHIKVLGEKDAILKPIKDNWGPRIGVAWQADPKTVVRAGYGLVYDALPSRSQYAQHQFEFWGWPQSSGFDTGVVNRLGDPMQKVEDLQGSFPFVVPQPAPWNASGWFNDPNRSDGYSHQWNVQIQREMTNSLMAAVSYVGSYSGRLEYSGQANSAQSPGPGTPAEVNARRPVPYLSGEALYEKSTATANYNSLQVKIQKHFSGGLASMFSYTWSKSIDTSSGWFSAENGVGGRTTQDYYHPDTNRAVSAYDVPHIMTWATVYDLPFGHGKRWVNEGVPSYILGNWQLNAVVLARSGQPFTPDVGGDIANIGPRSGWNYGRPNLIGDPHVANPSDAQWFNGAAFAKPVFAYGNSGRDILRTDGVFNVDFSLFKEIPFGEKRSMQFRFESFNLFNHMDLGNPRTRIDQSNPGRITSISHPPRQLQFGIRLQF